MRGTEYMSLNGKSQMTSEFNTKKGESSFPDRLDKARVCLGYLQRVLKDQLESIGQR